MCTRESAVIGRSTIAQRVAHLAAERGQLLSAFFFDLSDVTCNSAEHLVPTLAYEMTQQIPQTLEHVCAAILANPLIFFSPVERQIRSILLHPLCIHSESSLQGRRLLIIDGMDQCIDPQAQETIIRSLVSSLLSVSTEMISHRPRVLIVSRFGSPVASAFSAEGISSHIKYVPTDWNGAEVFVFMFSVIIGSIICCYLIETLAEPIGSEDTLIPHRDWTL